MMKGISSGDHSYRHFTFDETDIQTIHGIDCFKVNYGKDPLMPPGTEDEIGYVPCDKVRVIGGKKLNFPRSVKTETPKIERGDESVESVENVTEDAHADEPVEKSKPKAARRKIISPKKETTKKDKKTTKKVSKVFDDADDVFPEESGTHDIKPEKFEYRTDEFSGSGDASLEALQAHLNGLGEQGWELCGFDTSKQVFGSYHFFMIFKRRIIY